MTGDPRNAGTSTIESTKIIYFSKAHLESVGFINCKGTAIWRRTDAKFDIIKFDFIPKARCVRWNVPIGSFGVAVSALFPFLPRLGHSPRDGLRPEKGFGQIRLSFNRRISQPLIKLPNIWGPSNDRRTFELVAADILGSLQEKALPFFDRFDDSDELLRTLIQDMNAIGQEGVWEFGKLGSPSRLLYTGFAAIRCRQWEFAVTNLNACRQRILAIPELIGYRIQSELGLYIDQGIAAATEKRQWSIELRG